jgi:hypothetical protein
MKLKLVLALAILAAVAPAFAASHPHNGGAHMRPQLFHDRSPHVHSSRGSQPHHQA